MKNRVVSLVLCINSACSNQARYVDAWGQLQCGVCDALTMSLSVRITDLQALADAISSMADPKVFVPSPLSLKLIPDLFYALSEHPALLDSLVEQELISRKKHIKR